MNSSSNGDAKTTVQAFYEKGNFYRVIHADGVHGGLTPHGNLHFAFYNERRAIPRHVEFDLQNGIPGPERVLETKDGMFRELEADVVMTFPGAVSFYLWLGTQLEIARKQLGLSETDWNSLISAKK